MRLILIIVICVEASTSLYYGNKNNQMDRRIDKFQPLWFAGKSSPITYIQPGNGFFNLFASTPSERSHYLDNAIYQPSKLKKSTFYSNGRPFNVYNLKTTTTPSTTTTTTTTTAAPWKNSEITWLGKLLFNGMPKRLFHFQAPYQPLTWYDNDLNHLDHPSYNFV